MKKNIYIFLGSGGTGERGGAFSTSNRHVVTVDELYTIFIADCLSIYTNQSAVIVKGVIFYAHYWKSHQISSYLEPL